MNLGHRGEELIKRFESLRLEAYQMTPNDKWTIGWGHTLGVVPGMRIDADGAQAFFESDVAPIMEAMDPLDIPTESMADALASLCFNVGLGPLSGRTKIGWAVRQRLWFDVWSHMAQWRKIGGKDSLGLARRRAAEMALFWEDGL